MFIHDIYIHDKKIKMVYVRTKLNEWYTSE